MKAIAKKGFTVNSINCRSSKGNKLRKDREIKEGEELEVIEFFTANTMARNDKCVKVRRNGNILMTRKDKFDYKGNKTINEKHTEYRKKYINPLLEKFHKIKDKKEKLKRKIYDPCSNDCIIKDSDGLIKQDLTEKEEKKVKKIDKKVDQLEEKMNKIKKEIDTKHKNFKKII